MIAEADWTERADKRGLDPLGMQNAGIVLYQSLLPGISNVTLRMRYYGYYCWVSDAYARSGATNEFAAWRTWIRRSEALYALVSAHANGRGGVGGVEWADRRLAQGEDIIDFAEAASNDAGAVRYLRQSLGVFGGAYYSQMVEIGLFRQGKHGIQRATKGSGLAAAEAFRASIGPAVERLLIESIASARVARADLERLAPIIPSAIPETSAERDAYEQLLFSPANATEGDVSRAASLRLIIMTAQAMERRPDSDMVRWHLFALLPLNDERLEAQRVRWEAYQCQDLMQIAAAALLEWATGLMAVDYGRTLAEIEAEVRQWLWDDEPEAVDATWAELRDGIKSDGFDYRDAWSRLTGRRGTAKQKAWDAIRLMAALDQRLTLRADLREAARRELRSHGNARSIITELAWLAHRANDTVGDVMASYMMERVIRGGVA